MATKSCGIKYNKNEITLLKECFKSANYLFLRITID